MKVFMSSDIEGTCGICDWEEVFPGGNQYEYFRTQMSKEVSAAAGAALRAGVQDVLIKDAHNNCRNINPDLLPEDARLVRGSARSIYSMMAGIETAKFDAAMMTGYHSGARSNTNPLAHTETRRLEGLKINEELCTEFMINAYIAGYFGIPVCFVSGDKGICSYAKNMIPNIVTAPVTEGLGGASLSVSPKKAVKMIEEGVREAFTDDRYKSCLVKMPESFEVQVNYVSHVEAYENSFYPGVIQIGTHKIRYKSTNFVDVLRMIHFCV